MAKKRKTVEFVVNDMDQLRQVIEVQGKKAVVTTETRVVWPHEVSRADIDALAATAKERDNTAFHDQKELVVEIPGRAEEVVADTPDDLPTRIAERLNDFGISVTDWDFFDLTDEL